MFAIIRLIIWLTGFVVVSYFVLHYFGYDVNWNYWDERKAVCQERLKQCQNDLIRKGLDGARANCNFQCVDPKLIIHRPTASQQ